MKKTLCRIAGIFAVTLFATEAVRAQEPVLANIPFAFTAGDMTLPAGEYRVQKLSDASPALLIKNTEGKPAMMVIASTVEAKAPEAQTKLVFRRYGDQYFLSQVWTAGSTLGRGLPKSAKEKEQGLLARHQAPDQVTVVARLISPKLQ